MKYTKSLGEYRGKTLTWTQTELTGRHFELVSEKDVYATLNWQKMFGSMAEGTSAEEEITLKRGGFLRPYVSVRRSPKKNDIALLRMGFGGGGELEFTDGRRYTLRKLSFWKPEWGLTDWNGVFMFRISEKGGFLRHRGIVKLEFPFGRPNPNLTILLIVAWYSILLMRYEQAAAAGAYAGV